MVLGTSLSAIPLLLYILKLPFLRWSFIPHKGLWHLLTSHKLTFIVFGCCTTYLSITPLGMIQTPAASPDWQDGNNNQQDDRPHLNQDIPIDPSLILFNPTYLPHNGQYSPYPPKHSLQHADSNPPVDGAMHTQPRPDLTTYGRDQHPTYNEYIFSRTTTSHAFLGPAGVCSISGKSV